MFIKVNFGSNHKTRLIEYQKHTTGSSKTNWLRKRANRLNDGNTLNTRQPLNTGLFLTRTNWWMTLKKGLLSMTKTLPF